MCLCRLQLATQNVYYKQRNNLFFPVSAFTLPTTVLRIPYSLIFGGLWACFVYYVVGFSPTWSRCALQPACLAANVGCLVQTAQVN